MPPRIDPTRREITVGTRRVPFRLDLRNDRVSVTLGGAEMAVRPLQWREKMTLARFVDLGPEFLRDEVIRLCTFAELPATIAAEDAEVLWELAAWMSETPAAAPLPLDSRSLASVTLRLCRAMGLKPSDFDTRSAPEVEAMWEALGSVAQPEDERSAEESSSSSSSSSSTTTRIVIVPDEVAPMPSPQPVQTRTTVPDLHSAQAPASARVVGLKPDLRSAPAAQVQSIGAMVMSSVSSARTMTVTQVAEAMEDRQSYLSGQAGLPVLHHPIDAIAPVIEPRRSDGRQAAAPSTLRPAETRRTTVEPAAQETTQTMTPLRIDTLSTTPPEHALALTTATTHEDTPPHDFFEELADRLEQAAAEMGLGEE